LALRPRAVPRNHLSLAPPTHGQDNFEKVVHEFRPDVVITLAELWMIDWLPAHPVRPRFKWIAYFPVDGGPFYPPWEPILKDADEVVAIRHEPVRRGL
jgi:hypothetical protein